MPAGARVAPTRPRPAPGWLALVLAAAVLPAAAAGPSGPADGSDGPLDRFSLTIGALQARSDTDVTARASDGAQSAAGALNLERDLGLDQVEPVLRWRLEWLPGGRHGLALDAVGYRRSRTTTLARDIVYDDRTWAASARVEAELDYRFASATWRYWWSGPRRAVGLGLGLAHYRVDSRLEGDVTVDGSTYFASSVDRAQAMAPMLSLGWRESIGPRWRLYADVSGVAKDGGDLAGHVLEAALGIEWRMHRRASLALEAAGTHLRLDRRRPGLDARLDLKLHGPALLLRLH